MIIDNIKNASKYYSVHPQFRAVFEGLKKLDENSDCVRYDVDGDNSFYSLSSYTNKPVSECKFEAHRIYADIQYVISGHEHIDVMDAIKLNVTRILRTAATLRFTRIAAISAQPIFSPEILLYYSPGRPTDRL